MNPTPGLWTSHYDDNGFHYIDAANRTILFSYGESDEDRDNIQLAAAAPDLLTQLKSAAEMLNYLAPEKFDDDDHETNWNRMLADMDHAIAKAEGRQ